MVKEFMTSRHALHKNLPLVSVIKHIQQ